MTGIASIAFHQEEHSKADVTRARECGERPKVCGGVALFWVELCGMLEKLPVLRCLESQDRSGRRPKHVGTWPRSSTGRYKLLVNVTACVTAVTAM